MVTVNISGGAYSATKIDSAHLGANAVAPYQDVGLDQWDTLDDLVLEAGITSLRYPGGQAAEEYFDMENPNATSYQHDVLGVRPMLAQDAFLAFSGNNNISVTMMIPISGAEFTNGTLGADWIEQVRTYIQLTLAEADDNGVTIDAFEIGNEYRAYMTHSEYGQIVDTIAVLLQEEFDAFVPEGIWSEPMIAVQVRAPNSHLKDEVVETDRNETIIGELSSDALAAIDALIGHYYFSTGEVDEIPAQLAHGWSLFEAWEDAAGKNMDWIITEWNVYHDYQANLGLAQINPLLEILTEFLKAGIDAAQIWSTQYNENSIGTGVGAYGIAQGDPILRASGELFKLMLDKSIGMSAVDMDATGTAVAVHGFADSETALLFISSLETSSILLDLGLGFDDGALIGSTVFGTSGSYSDENADVTLTYDSYVNNQDITLGAFETLMIEIDLMRQGSSADDRFTGSAFADNMVGAGGSDTLIGNDGNDQLFGGNGNDYLSGGDGADLIFGAANNDKLIGGNGDDELYGGTYWDSLFGGNGDDTLYGDGGNDYLVAGSGDDILYGGAGNDTLYAGAGTDIVLGGNGDDTIIAGGGNDTVNGGSGIDMLTGGGGSDVFVFDETGTKWNEVITDFVVGDDTIAIALDGVNSVDDIMIFADETTGIWTVHFRPNKDVSFIHNGSIQLEGSFTYGELYDAENFDFG